MDNPDSSYIAQILSYFVLLVIVLSSIGFILSTAPEFQKEPVGVFKPEPEDVFGILENVCLSIFLIEYVIRLCTCWAVRAELTEDKLLELTVGYEVIQLTTPGSRFFGYLSALSNIIDLVAILPGIIGWIQLLADPDSAGSDGGAFVVLRLVRLTRIFRAFKNPKLVEPVIVIARTMSNSTKALYLLGFNGLLGILISGSLMYLVEKGEWDWETRKYNRYIGREWNATSATWMNITAESPFLSIPHSFWWAVVTSTTVGFGDVYPTTTWGYVVATMTMVFSLVIAALPVGVIGGNFTQVWSDYDLENRREAAQTEKDRKFITSAIQRIDPHEMSKLVYIEVWNERFPDTASCANDARSKSSRPDVAEFLGQAHLFLDLNPQQPVALTLTLPLQDGAEGGLPHRKLTGNISLQYEWQPLITTFAGGDQPPDPFRSVQGKLKVTVCACEGLMNLTYTRGKRSGSNPYCRVFCYPDSPTENNTLCPRAWRGPLAVGTLSPKWHACHTFNFCWKTPQGRLEPNDAPLGSIQSKQDIIGRSDGTFAGPAISKKGQVAALVQSVGRELLLLREELRSLNNRITRFSSTTEPPAERMN